MKLIIAGGRDIGPAYCFNLIDDWISRSMDHVDIEYEIVSGGAKGVDFTGEKIAESYEFPVTKFPADWSKHGKAAGPIRNRAMAVYADKLLLVWDGQSRGSANMKSEMEKLGKPVYEIIIRLVSPLPERE